MSTVNKIGGLTGFGMVWYYEYGIGNILSLNSMNSETYLEITWRLGIIKYIRKLLEAFSQDIKGQAKTPTSTHLFNTNPESKKLSKIKGHYFITR